MTTSLHPPRFSDAAIRQFLLGQMRGSQRVAFERALFLDASLEQKTRLEEIALADDYAMDRLRGKDLDAFTERFASSAARRNQIEVSRVLSECFTSAESANRDEASLKLMRPMWKWAFAAIVLIMLFATIWLATKEPRIAGRFPPHRNRPAATTTPTPEVAHHGAGSAETRTHQDESSSPPSHEVAAEAIVLSSITSAEDAPIVNRGDVRDKYLPLQLLLDEASLSTYRIELMTREGGIIYTEEALTAESPDRIKFNLPVEQLSAGDFRIHLTRMSDGRQATYYLHLK